MVTQTLYKEPGWSEIAGLTSDGAKRTADHCSSIHFDDLRFPATAINPPGSASDPDFDTIRGGWLFADGSTELLFILGQLPHNYNEGSTLHPHIHWVQENSGDVLWQLDFKWFNNGAEYPADFTTLQTVKKVFNYSSGSLSQISAFQPITGEGMGISSMFAMKLSRIGGDAADTYTGDALMMEFDFHYEIDGHGSEREYLKEA